MERLRVGVYGCGMISEFHLKGWQRIPEVELVALGNRTLRRAEERRAQFCPDARVYGELEPMLQEERLDILDILTVPSLHRAQCLLATQAGVHVICQKPLCDTLGNARDLVAAMRGSPRLFAVHENHRYRPWFQRIVQCYQEGFFGAPCLLRLEQHDATEPPEAYKNQTALGILLEYGTHLVDMTMALLGRPERVYARLHRPNPKVRGESLAHIVYAYPGASTLIDIAWQDRGVARGSVVFLGERGSAYLEGSMGRAPSARFRLVQDGQVVVDETRSPWEDYCQSFYLFQREFVDCIRTGAPVTQSGDVNLRTFEATFAAYASAREGRVVEVAEFVSAG